MYRKPFENHFYGDDPRWFVGVVETPSAADSLGRVRVRVYGLHSNSTADIDTDDLPLAQVMIPGTEEGTKGLGMNAQLEVGAMVFGIFLDGKASQLPFVLGSFPRIEIADPAVSGYGTSGGAVDPSSGAPLGTTSQLSDEEVQRILNSEESDLARVEAEKYLGREMSDQEWAALLSATVAESLPNSPEEQAAVMAVILNRVKSPAYPDNVIDVLYQPNQFQAVTGAAGSGPSPNYINPSDAQLASTISGVNEYLSSSNTTWLNFTSNNPAAYGPGTNINFLYTMRSSPGSRVIGGTVFGTAR